MSHHIHRSALTTPDPIDREQSEPLDISSALDVEQLDTNLFRSRSLYLPYRARGVFGGQVISQGLVAATKSVKPDFALHSLHCYFLQAVTPSIPVLYYVDRVREGRSYATRLVRAVQGGKDALTMMCSFQLPEPWQPSQSWKMYKVAPPESCPDEVELLRRMATEQLDRTEDAKAWLRGYAQAREESPVAVKHAGEHIGPDGRRTFLYWMKAKTDKKFPVSLHKVVFLLYLRSERLTSAFKVHNGLHFRPSLVRDIIIMTRGTFENTVPSLSMAPAITGAGLKRSLDNKGPKALAMASSLDHSIVFYEHEFDCTEWFLYAMTSQVSGHGRGCATGLLYSREGKLLAVANQEGVMRANIRDPKKNGVKEKAKI
ncbi:thioesterase II [Lactarius akahatsu]|uniref:Thioesterase II n=1 Tax=Lactarius akahatsu TaxID=416441 RepID=A0AAD4LT12_9AGAM|nr:thioesterase II [Lactarius akahatsu]